MVFHAVVVQAKVSSTASHSASGLSRAEGWGLRWVGRGSYYKQNIIGILLRCSASEAYLHSHSASGLARYNVRSLAFIHHAEGAITQFTEQLDLITGDLPLISNINWVKEIMKTKHGAVRENKYRLTDKLTNRPTDI